MYDDGVVSLWAEIPHTYLVYGLKWSLMSGHEYANQHAVYYFHWPAAQENYTEQNKKRQMWSLFNF